MTAEALPRPGGMHGFMEGVKGRFSPRTTPVSSREFEAAHEVPPLEIAHGTVQTRTLEVMGRQVDAYHVTPDPDIAYKGRLFLASGWRSKVPGQKDFIARLVESGYAVTTFTNDFTRGDREAIREADKKLDTRGLPKIPFVKAAAVKEAIDAFTTDQEDEKVGIIAHSEATIYAGIAAKDFVDAQFLIQINSAGHAKKSTFVGLMAKGVRESIQNRKAEDTDPEDINPKEKVSPSGVISYVRRNTALARQELLAIRQMNTDRLIEYLHDKGLPTGYIKGIRDKLFPHSYMERVIAKGIFNFVGEVPDGAHEICSDPNGYAMEVLAAIDSFGMKQEVKLDPQGVVFQS